MRGLKIVLVVVVPLSLLLLGAFLLRGSDQPVLADVSTAALQHFPLHVNVSSTPLKYSGFADIAVNEYAVVVVWSEGTDNPSDADDSVVRMAQYDGTSWSVHRVDDRGGYTARGPAVVLVGNKAHFVWVGQAAGSGDDKRIFYRSWHLVNKNWLDSDQVYREVNSQADLGTVRFMTVHLEQGWVAGRLAKGQKGDWRSEPGQAGGGQLVDTGSHTVAALLYVTQLVPVEVFAYVDSCGLDVDVNTAMVVRFADGAQASISIGGFGHKVTESLRVVGDKASARIFFRTVREQSLEIDGQAVDAASMVRRSTPNANFVDAILGKASLGADGELGLRVAQLSEAAYESARRGAPVRLA